MIRRLNYTGRVRILREDARLVIIERPGMPLIFEAGLDLTGYGLPEDASVYVEAYRQIPPTWMRFDFGTMAHIEPPPSTELTAFDSAEGILFRLRVTSLADAGGKLLAEADSIRGRKTEEIEETVDPLLPVQPVDLGAEIWSLDTSDGPRLLINRALWDWKAVAVTPAFVSLVYPAVLRQILGTVLLEEKCFEVDDEDYWCSRWLRFASLIPGVPDIPDEQTDPEKIKEWIHDVVSAFSRQQNMLNRVLTFWRPESTR